MAAKYQCIKGKSIDCNKKKINEAMMMRLGTLTVDLKTFKCTLAFS